MQRMYIHTNMNDCDSFDKAVYSKNDLQVVAAVPGSRVMFFGESFFTGVVGNSFSFFRLL